MFLDTNPHRLGSVTSSPPARAGPVGAPIALSASRAKHYFVATSQDSTMTSVLAVVIFCLWTAAAQQLRRVIFVQLEGIDVRYLDSSLAEATPITNEYGIDQAPMPYFKRLMAEGTTFARGYVPSPKCAPSRFSILTGRLPSRCRNLQPSTCSDDTPCAAEVPNPLARTPVVNVRSHSRA